MAEKMGPIISTNGLVFCVDAANPQSIVSGQTIWKDLTFNTTGGTLTNGVIFTGTGVSSGLSYDGTDDYISNINGVSTTNQISVNAWIRPRSVNNFQHIVDASNNTWHLAILNTNNVYFWDGFNYQRSGATVNANFNYMVTGVRNTTTNRIYLNGSLTESIAGTNNIPTNTINISRWQGINTGATPSRYFTGTTYGVQIYDRGITPFEVFQNFNAMKGRYGIPDIVTGGLILNLDAGNPYSYNPDNTASTVWTDVSYTSSGGTLINGTYYSGGTMFFDGVDDYVSLGTSFGNFGTDNFTINYVYKSTYTLSQTLQVLGKTIGGSPASDYGWLVATATNEIYFAMASTGVGGWGATGTYIKKTSGANVNDGNWHIITIIVDRSQSDVKIFKNGVLQTLTAWVGSGGNLTTVGNVANTYDARIGAEADNQYYFPGNIATAQIYNRALSDSEVQQNFNALRGRYGI